MIHAALSINDALVNLTQLLFFFCASPIWVVFKCSSISHWAPYGAGTSWLIYSLTAGRVKKSNENALEKNTFPWLMQRVKLARNRAFLVYGSFYRTVCTVCTVCLNKYFISLLQFHYFCFINFNTICILNYLINVVFCGIDLFLNKFKLQTRAQILHCLSA